MLINSQGKLAFFSLSMLHWFMMSVLAVIISVK